MDATRMTRSPLRAVTLAGLTLTAVVVACDTEAPTALDDALLDVLADPEAAVNADGVDNPGALQIRGALGDGAPLIFVDGVELEAGSAALGSLNPDDIESIEVIKGEAATELYGERAENGVIQILTIESAATEAAEPSASDAPPSREAGETQISATWTVRDGSLPHLGRSHERTGALLTHGVRPVYLLVRMDRVIYYNIDRLMHWADADAMERANDLRALLGRGGLRTASMSASGV